MNAMAEEDPALNATLNLLDSTYRQWTGEHLPCALIDPHSRAAWIHREAPYSLVFHNNDNDPVFTYGNECALRCFKYSREVFCGMPSRFSASSVDREARQALLNIVGTQGFASGYTGYRVDRYGHAFMIYDGIVWEVRDDTGTPLGQAALFWPHPDTVARIIQIDPR
jgi:hypothetical protein